MKGYTIENSIDLLEKDVKALKEGGGGGGGASTWNQLTNKPFNTLGDELYSLSGALTLRELSSDKVKLPDSEAYTWEDVSEAIDELATEQAAVDEELSHINEDIVDLTTNVNSLSTSKQDKLTAGANITIEDNVVSADVGEVYSTDEIVIGTWLGKTLYRRVWSFTNRALTSGRNVLISGIPNLYLHRANVIQSNSAHTYIAQWSGYSDNNIVYWGYNSQNGDFTLDTQTSWSTPNIEITLEYTKEV